MQTQSLIDRYLPEEALTRQDWLRVHDDDDVAVIRFHRDDVTLLLT
jgi:hypothetical protein